MFLSYNVFLKTDIIMIMKQVLKRTDTIMAACLSALLFSWLPVAANSALQYWEGSDASGVMTTDQDCPVIVGHETLTFMLDDAKEPDSMDRFAAEYTFVNPSDLQVTASLAFPFGSRPFYLTSSGSYDDPSLYRVLVNGEEIEPAVRYTWLGTEKFSVGNDLARLRDGYIGDTFFRKDLPVYQYTLHFSLEDEGMFEESGCYIQAETDVINDPARIRYLLSGDFAGYGNDQSHAYIVMSLSQKEQDAVVYAFGQESDFAFTSFRTTENMPREMQGSCTVTKVEEMTYEEYVMANKPADLAISDTDHYNALTEMFRSDEDFRFIMPDLYGYEGGLMKWYTYQLAFGPGETLTNTVEAPIWPSVDASYEEPEYEYRYLLSPASSWKEFKGLDVVINSGYEMLECSLEGFAREENCYRAHFDRLPEEELSFTMCSTAAPKKKTNGIVYVIIGYFVFLLLGSLLLIYLIARLIKKIFTRK